LSMKGLNTQKYSDALNKSGDNPKHETL